MATTEVTFEDQQRINTFGKLNSRMHELNAAIKAKKASMEALEDASNEIMIADDDVVHYVYGECFLHMDGDEADGKITIQSERTEKEVVELEEELAGTTSQMADLKQVLYAKFGESINLEE